MTQLTIIEEIRYVVDHDGTPAEAMREFLQDPNRYLMEVRERSVNITDPQLSEEDSIAAYEAISEVEMNG